MKRTTAFLLVLVAPLCATSLKTALIGSQHDLTATGTGPVKSTQVGACIFCHAPHNIVPNVAPLWDQTLSAQSYTTYSSSTYTSGAETPAAGSSKLCLSCHDGTVAVGLTVALGKLATSGAMAPADVIGTNLTNSHPLSMTPVDDGSLAASLFGTPASTRDAAVKLVAGKVECTTCHDPHSPKNDTANPMFLVRSNASGAICLACHDPTRPQPNFLYGWNASAHATASNAVPAGGSFAVYGTVASDACSSCHGAHNNAVGPRDQKALEGAACTPCHAGANVTPVIANINAEFSKTYRHPAMTVTGVHDPKEGVPVNNTRHAACADCHNPHASAAQTSTAVPPALDATLTGVSGYDTSGVLTPALKEYQICFKCHADSTNKPATSTFGRTAVRYPGGPMPAADPAQPPRPADQYNVRLKFTGAIGHNVMGNSVATTAVPSLRPYMLNIDGVTNNATRPLTRTTLLYCSDCHNSDQARSSGGTGPNGPHGSTFPHLLQLNFLQDVIGGSGGGGTAGAALCGKCHNLTTVRAENPHGSPHSGYSCSTCHDPHGVIGGNPGANRAMLNFDTGITSKSTTYYGYFYLGAGSGQKGCYLNCHGTNHNPNTY